MSETPIFPVSGETSGGKIYTTETQDYAAQANESLASWTEGFDVAERFNLDRDEAINPLLWSDTSKEALTVAPEYAAPKTRADELALSLESLTDKQLHEQLDAHTRAIVHGLRKQHYELAA